MNQEWTPGLLQARRRLVSSAKQEMQLLENLEVIELAKQMLKTTKFEHSHFSGLTSQQNCAGCIIQLLVVNFPDFNNQCLEEVNIDKTINFFAAKLHYLQFTHLDNDQ